MSPKKTMLILYLLIITAVLAMCGTSCSTVNKSKSSFTKSVDSTWNKDTSSTTKTSIDSTVVSKTDISSSSHGEIFFTTETEKSFDLVEIDTATGVTGLADYEITDADMKRMIIRPGKKIIAIPRTKIRETGTAKINQQNNSTGQTTTGLNKDVKTTTKGSDKGAVSKDESGKNKVVDRTSYTGWIITGVCSLLLLVLAIVVWYYRKRITWIAKLFPDIKKDES